MCVLDRQISINIIATYYLQNTTLIVYNKTLFLLYTINVFSQTNYLVKMPEKFCKVV